MTQQESTKGLSGKKSSWLKDQGVQLQEALQQGSLALCIGADLPTEITGLPSRADLAQGLARRYSLDETLSLAEVAQRVSRAGNRWAFTEFIRNVLDTTGKSTLPFHQLIVELAKMHPIKTLITTAYDNLLELTFQEAGVGLTRVVHGSDVAFIRPDRPTLIKLYGDSQQPDSLVVTDRDHSDLLHDQDKKALIEEVRHTFRHNIVFFLGYNLSGPDFRFLFDQIAKDPFARTAYAVWLGLPEADVTMWRDRGIVILETDPIGLLDDFLALTWPIGQPKWKRFQNASTQNRKQNISNQLDQTRQGSAPPAAGPKRNKIDRDVIVNYNLKELVDCFRQTVEQYNYEGTFTFAVGGKFRILERYIIKRIQQELKAMTRRSHQRFDIYLYHDGIATPTDIERKLFECLTDLFDERAKTDTIVIIWNYNLPAFQMKVIAGAFWQTIKPKVLPFLDQKSRCLVIIWANIDHAPLDCFTCLPTPDKFNLCNLSSWFRGLLNQLDLEERLIEHYLDRLKKQEGHLIGTYEEIDQIISQLQGGVTPL